MPTDISVDDDLVPGGDIRIRANSWLRSAYKATKLESVPRETQFRLAVGKIMAKRKIGPWDSIHHVLLKIIFVQEILLCP